MVVYRDMHCYKPGTWTAAHSLNNNLNKPVAQDKLHLLAACELIIHKLAIYILLVRAMTATKHILPTKHTHIMSRAEEKEAYYIQQNIISLVHFIMPQMCSKQAFVAVRFMHSTCLFGIRIHKPLVHIQGVTFSNRKCF